MNTKIIKPHTRTIFIKIEEKRFTHFPEHTKKQLKKYKALYKEINESNKYKDGLYYKFKLNIPQLEVKSHRLNIEGTLMAYTIKPIEIVNNKTIYYHSPLLNTADNGEICMGEYYNYINLENVANDLFNSYFNLSLVASVKNYINNNSTIIQSILDFYQNWEENGFVDLLKE